MKVKATALLDACDIAASLGSYGIAVVPQEDGWEIWSKGDSKISAVYAKLLTDAFPDGYAQGDGFTVKHGFFSDATARGAEPDITAEGGKLTIKDGKRRQSVRLDGFDAYGAVKVMPSYTPEASMAIMADDLKVFFRQKQLKDFKGHLGIRLTLTQDGLTAKTEDELTSFEDFLPCDAVTLPEGVESVTARFMVDAIIPMIMAMPKGAIVTLGFDTNHPVEMTVNTEELQARLLLAPLIAEDEE